jgi:hypothetical protein
VIEEIKNVPTELQIHVFMDRELFLKRPIEVVETRAGHDVAAGVAVGETGRD